jgi:hypothetical protein
MFKKSKGAAEPNLNSIITRLKKNNMYMKRFLLFIVLFSITFLSNAQNNTTKSYLLLNGGANYATFFQSSNNVNNLGGIWGPNAGLSVRTITPTWWGVEAGINYSVKGTNFKDTAGKVYIGYAGAHFDGLLIFPLINNDDAYVGVGVYTAYAVNGKLKKDSSTTDIDFGGGTWRAFDAGLQLKGGYMIKNTIGINVHYDLGFIPTYTSVDLRGDTNHGRNSVFTVTLSLKLAKVFDR